MSTDIETAVEELLADLAAVFADESSDDGQPDPEALDELADRAAELVSTTEHSELLVASGLGDDDEPPASLPAAVVSGAPQNVARLRSLLTASKLSTADDGREERVDELQSLVETAQGEPSAEANSDSEAPEDDTASTSNAESDAESDTGNDQTESTKSGAEDDESTSPIRDLLESQLEDTHGIFDSIPDIETLTGSLGEDEDEKAGNDETRDEKTGDNKARDEKARDDEENAETAEADESQEDQSTKKRDGTRFRPGGGQQATHSTVASSGRRDIGQRAGQFSSVRGSTVSKR